MPLLNGGFKSLLIIKNPMHFVTYIPEKFFIRSIDICKTSVRRKMSNLSVRFCTTDIHAKPLTKVYQHSITKSTVSLLKNLNATDIRGAFFEQNYNDNRASIFLYSRSIDFMAFTNSRELNLTPFIQRSYINAFGNGFLYLFFITLLLLNFNHPSTADFIKKAMPNINILYESEKNSNCQWRGIITQYALKEAIASYLCHLTTSFQIPYRWPTIGANSVIRDFMEVLFMQNIHCQSTINSDNPADWYDSLELDEKIIMDDYDNFYFVPSKKGILLFVPKSLLRLKDDSFPICIPLIYDEKVPWQDTIDFEITPKLDFHVKSISRYPSMPNSEYLDNQPVFLDQSLFNLLKFVKNGFGNSGITFSAVSKLAPEDFAKHGKMEDTFLMYALPDEATKIIMNAFITIINFLHTATPMDSKNNIVVTFIKNPTLFEKQFSFLDITRFHNVIKTLGLHTQHSYYQNILAREVLSFYTNIVSGLTRTRQSFLGGTGFSVSQAEAIKIYPKIFTFKSTFFFPLLSADCFCGFLSTYDFLDNFLLISSMLSFRFTILRVLLIALLFFLFIQIYFSESVLQVPFEYRRFLPKAICGIIFPFGYRLSSKLYTYFDSKILYLGGGIIIDIKESPRALVASQDRILCEQLIIKSPVYQSLTNKGAANHYFSNFLSGDFLFSKDSLKEFTKADFFSIMRLRASVFKMFYHSPIKAAPNDSKDQEDLNLLFTEETLLLKRFSPSNVVLPLSENCHTNLAWGESSCNFSFSKSLSWQINVHIRKQTEYIQVFEFIVGPVTLFNAENDLRRTDFLAQEGHPPLLHQLTFSNQCKVPEVLKLSPSSSLSAIDVTSSSVTSSNVSQVATSSIKDKVVPLSCLNIQDPPYTLLKEHITAHLIMCDNKALGQLLITKIERLKTPYKLSQIDT